MDTLTGANGAAISTVPDLSPNSRPLVQGTSGNKPTILTSGTPSGRKVASTADSTDELGVAYCPAPPWTAYIAFYLTSTSTGNIIWFGTSGNGLTIDTGGGSQTLRPVLQNVALGSTNASFTTSTWYVLTVSMSTTSGATLAMRLNGTAKTVTQSGTMATAGQSMVFRAGAAGRLALAAVYSEVHSDTVKAATETAISAALGL